MNASRDFSCTIFVLYFLSRIVSRERSMGTSVALLLRDKRAQRVSVRECHDGSSQATLGGFVEAS
jgi:hypothetical protein